MSAARAAQVQTPAERHAAIDVALIAAGLEHEDMGFGFKVPSISPFAMADREVLAKIEPERAAAWMRELKIGFDQMGSEFQVHRFGRLLTSGEVMAWLSGTSTTRIQPEAAKGMVW